MVKKSLFYLVWIFFMASFKVRAWQLTSGSDGYTVSPASAPIFTWNFYCCCGHKRNLCAWGVRAKIYILLCLLSYYPHILAFVVMEGFFCHVNFMQCWVACDISYSYLFTFCQLWELLAFESLSQTVLVTFTQPSGNSCWWGCESFLNERKKNSRMCGQGLSIRYLLFLS